MTKWRPEPRSRHWGLYFYCSNNTGRNTSYNWHVIKIPTAIPLTVRLSVSTLHQLELVSMWYVVIQPVVIQNGEHEHGNLEYLNPHTRMTYPKDISNYSSVFDVVRLSNGSNCTNYGVKANWKLSSTANRLWHCHYHNGSSYISKAAHLKGDTDDTNFHSQIWATLEWRRK